MNVPSVPDEIVALADERAAARARRDYRTADELKARVEAAGWKVVDFGVAYELEPTRPPDVVEGERTLYGSVESVPSRLHEQPMTEASVIVILDQAADATGCLEAIAAAAPGVAQVVVVHGPDTVPEGPFDDAVGMALPFGAGDALQAALRRTTGAVVVVLEPESIATGDVFTPLIEALADPSVAIAAAEGLVSHDLHRYHPAEQGDVTTVASGCYAFRRADAIERGPIDGRLRLRGSVAAWLGLLLRDEGPDATPRRALALDLPVRQAAEEGDLPEDHARLARRDGYRLADRFRDHAWLAGDEPPQGWVVGDRRDERDGGDEADESDHAEQA